MTHECLFTAGELLALGAIAETRSRQEHAPAGARRLAEMCYEHARLHPVPRSEERGDHVAE